MNETYTTRDLNDYRELQAYCKQLKNEMNAWLNYAQQVDMTVAIKRELNHKGHSTSELGKYYLKLNGSKQYLQDWVEAVISASYTVGVTSEINWF